MLKEVRLSNFRGFSDHVLPLSAATVIVGRNNAGKSTIVEALSLISLVTNRYMSLTYRKPPTELGLSDRYLGVQPSLKGLEIELANVCHEYSDPPANIVANFAGGESIRIYLSIRKGCFSRCCRISMEHLCVANRAQVG